MKIPGDLIVNWSGIYTRVAFQAKKMTFIFYQPTGNDV